MAVDNSTSVGNYHLPGSLYIFLCYKIVWHVGDNGSIKYPKVSYHLPNFKALLHSVIL